MPDPTLHPIRIKDKRPGPLIIEAPPNRLLRSRPTDIPRVDLIIGMRIEIINVHIRGGGDADLEVGFLLIAEREGFIAVAIRRDEDGFSDRCAIGVQVRCALAEIADGRAAADAGSGVALRIHEAWVAGGYRGFIVGDVWCVCQGTAGSATRQWLHWLPGIFGEY